MRTSYMLLLAMTMAVMFPPGAVAQEPVICNSVKVEGNWRVSADEITYLIGLKPGNPVDYDEVSRGIKRLFKKGIFERVDVSANPGQPGELVISVLEKAEVERISFTGNRSLSKSFLRESFPLKEDMMIEPGGIERARSALLAGISRKGYPYASIEIEVKQGKASRGVALFVMVHEGEPIIIKNIITIGRKDYPDYELAGMISLEPGDVFDQLRLERDIKRIERFLLARGHLKPEVGPYTIVEGELVLGIQPGHRLSVRVKGNELLSDNTLLKAMPFFEVGEVSDDLIGESVSRMQELYRKAGISSIQVATVRVDRGDDIELAFFINEGKGVLIRKIDAISNAVDPARIRKMMSVTERSPFVRHELDRDLERVRDLYIALGYLNVSIREPVIAEKDSRVDIEIEISEGSQTLYGSVDILTGEDVPRELLLGALSIKPGEPYNEVDISDARRNILGVCRSVGYYRCDVNVKRTIVDGRADIGFEINEGPLGYFGKTILLGNEKTRWPAVAREIRYREGTIIDPSSLSATRQKLSRTGLFKEVAISQVDAGNDVQDVVIEVQEAKHGTVEFGLGYGEYERQRGFVEFSYRNFSGMNRKGAFRTEQSTLWGRYILNYQEPYLFGAHLLSSTTLMYEKRKEKNIDTDEISYQVEKKSITTGVEKEITERTKGTLYYSFSIVRTYDLQSDVVISREDTGTLNIGSLSPGLIYDGRDNPFDPSRGVYGGLTLKFAATPLASDTEFVKSTAQAAAYYPLFDRLVTAFSVKTGLADGYSKTHELPLVERFFLGGRNTVRGYKQDGLGPVGANGTPTGGNAFLLLNAELRLKITNNWRLVPFVDAGNVWRNNTDMNTGELKYTAGLGIQYNTPVGPIRVDYGKKLKPEPGESKYEIHFSIGHAF